MAGEVKVQNIKHILVVIPRRTPGGKDGPGRPTNGSGRGAGPLLLYSHRRCEDAGG